MRCKKHPIVAAAGAVLLTAGWAAGQAATPIINPTAPGAAPPAGQAPAAAQAALPADATADQVLDALDRRGQDLRGFTAKVKLTETDEGTQLSSTRSGRAWYQKKGAAGDDARIRVLFDTRLDEKKQAEQAEKIEYMLDNGWLTDRDYQKRIEVRRQVLRPGEKINLLKLGEGPFPLPIGQKKEEVKKLFTVTRVKAAKDDPPGTVHLLLKPVKGSQFARKFSSIDVWVDAKTHFPRRIDTLDPKETISRSTELTDVQVNPDMSDADFTLTRIPPDQWNIHEEPFKE